MQLSYSYKISKYSLILLLMGNSLYPMVQVGKGSYALGLPSGAKGPINSQGNPVFPKVTSDFTKVPTTTDWWSSLIWQFQNPWSENLFAHPLSFKCAAGGVNMGYPTYVAINPNHLHEKGHVTQEYHNNHTTDLIVGIDGLNAPDTRVADYSDWAVKARWDDGVRRMEMMIGHGFPFAYFTMTGGDAVIDLTGSNDIWFNDNGVVGVTVRGHHYGIFGPSGSVWTGSNIIRSSLSGNNYLSVALLPDNTLETLEFYRKRAYAFITDTHFEWQYDQDNAEVITTFNTTTELKEAGNGNLNQPLLALYRHQWLNTNDPLTNYSYTSPRGEMKVYDGASFTTHMRFNGVLPSLPNVAVNGQDTYSDTQLYNYVDQIYQGGTNINSGDTYWNGKAMGRLAQLLMIADQVGHTAAKNQFLADLKNIIERWLNASSSPLYAYHEPWNVLIGFPPSYGSDTQLNDHHFHWGYLIIAAAIVAQYDSAWAANSEWGGMVEHLIKDPANWDKNDTQYPFLRQYDPYAGHAWANGSALFAAGNNQESSSESINFSTGLILWGSATGNHTIRDLGIFLYTTEVAAIEQYWFDVDNAVFPQGFDKPYVAIVWSNGGSYAIWWSGYVEEVHGINFLPITGGSLYLGRHPDYLRLNQDFMNSNGGGNNSWRDIHMNVKALYDSTAAIQDFNTVPFNSEAGESRAHTYHWIHNLNVLGQLDTQVTANIPTYAVFNKNGVRSYVAYNPQTTPVTVTFSDGGVLDVGARSLAWARGSDTGSHELPSENDIPDETTTDTQTDTTTDTVTDTVTDTSTDTVSDTPDESPTVTYEGDGFTITAQKVGSGIVTIAFKPSWASTFVDIHYAVNNGGQLNVRMQTVGNDWEHQIGNLKDGDVITYHFTYERNGAGHGVEQLTYTYHVATDPIETVTDSTTDTPDETTTDTQTDTMMDTTTDTMTDTMTDSMSDTPDDVPVHFTHSVEACTCIYFVPDWSPQFVDVYYSVNGDNQHYERMENKCSKWVLVLNSLQSGDVVHYHFVYEQAGAVVTSSSFEHTV